MKDYNLQLKQEELEFIKGILNISHSVLAMEILKKIEEQEYLNNLKNKL